MSLAYLHWPSTRVGMGCCAAAMFGRPAPTGVGAAILVAHAANLLVSFLVLVRNERVKTKAIQSRQQPQALQARQAALLAWLRDLRKHPQFARLCLRQEVTLDELQNVAVRLLPELSEELPEKVRAKIQSLRPRIQAPHRRWKRKATLRPFVQRPQTRCGAVYFRSRQKL